MGTLRELGSAEEMAGRHQRDEPVGAGVAAERGGAAIAAHRDGVLPLGNREDDAGGWRGLADGRDQFRAVERPPERPDTLARIRRCGVAESRRGREGVEAVGLECAQRFEERGGQAQPMQSATRVRNHESTRSSARK